MSEFVFIEGQNGYRFIEDCKHERQELRRRTRSNGVRVCGYQCLSCGRQAQPESIRRVNIDKLPPWDEKLEPEYWRRRSDAAQQEYERKKQEENSEWRHRYESHLQSPEWQIIRRKVFDRSGGICEGCHERRAVQVHHLTYARLGHEMLFDLVAVCIQCHESIHKDE